MRRYAIVQKARDADVFGILVGTLGVGSPLLSLPTHPSS
jgi:diphthamide biosynthesis protein 2